MRSLADRPASSGRGLLPVTTEFDHPCADCGRAQVRRQVDRTGATVTVTACQNRVGRYCLESGLQTL